VLTFYIERRTGIRTLQDVTVAKLNLVDLAGNEHVKKTSDYRGRLRREAMAINKSLTFLEQVLYPSQTRNLDPNFTKSTSIWVRTELATNWNYYLIKTFKLSCAV
jgi:hypothetical protein